MSLINIKIPESSFEKVRDAISAILKLELENQKILQPLTDEILVYSGRCTPFAHSEKLMINVLVDSANYTAHNQHNSTGVNMFFVDIYTSAKESINEIGDKVSSDKRDLYLRMIRYILQDHHYNTLALPAGFILGTYVEGFENFESKNAQDAAFVKMARLNFGVRLNESQSLWAGININTIFTNVKLDLTEKGYIWEINN